jgi:hypothetical protein
MALPAAATDDEVSPPSIEVFREPPLALLEVGAFAGEGVIKSMTQADGVVPREVSASRQLADALKAELERRSVPVGAVPDDVLPQKRGRSLHGDTANSLQVFTDYNAISYLPMHWATYQFGMKGRARLIDGAGRVAWEMKCYIKHTTADPRFQIKKDQFDPEGRRVREVVKAVAQDCARLIGEQVQNAAERAARAAHPTGQ